MSSKPRPTKADVVADFRKAQILTAAREAFAKHGLGGTTVDTIAKRAGVAKGTVYLYYRSKDEVLRQLLEDDLAALHAMTVPVIRTEAPLAERLAAFLAASLTFFEQRRDFFDHAHFEMAADVRRKTLQRLNVVHEAQVDAWRDVLREGEANGEVVPGSAEAAAATIVALASGLAKQRLRGWLAASADEASQQAASTLWKGLAAR